MELTGPSGAMTKLVMQNFDRAHFDNWVDPNPYNIPPDEYPDSYDPDPLSPEEVALFELRNKFTFVADGDKINIEIVKIIYERMEGNGLLLTEILGYSICDAWTLSLASHHVITVFRSQPKIDLPSEEKRGTVEKLSLETLQRPLVSQLLQEIATLSNKDYYGTRGEFLDVRLRLMGDFYHKQGAAALAELKCLEDFSELILDEALAIASIKDKIALIDLAEKIDAHEQFGPKIFSTYEKLHLKIKRFASWFFPYHYFRTLLSTSIHLALLFTVMILPVTLQFAIAVICLSCLVLSIIFWGIQRYHIGGERVIEWARFIASHPLSLFISFSCLIIIPLLGSFVLSDTLDRHYFNAVENRSKEELAHKLAQGMHKVHLVWDSFPKFPT